MCDGTAFRKPARFGLFPAAGVSVFGDRRLWFSRFAAPRMGGPSETRPSWTGLAGRPLCIFNQGILAKTFYLAKNVPIPTFDGCGYVGGIAIPWAITISLRHALHSLLHPIFAIYYFFPSHHESPWLNRKGITALTIPTVLFGVLLFFGQQKDRQAGQPPSQIQGLKDVFGSRSSFEPSPEQLTARHSPVSARREFFATACSC